MGHSMPSMNWKTKLIIHKKNKRDFTLTQIHILGDPDDHRFRFRNHCL